VGTGNRWAHCTPEFHALSYCFAVRSDDEELARRAQAVFAGLRTRARGTPGPAEAGVRRRCWYSVRTAGDGAVDVWRDEAVLAACGHPDEAISWIVWDVNRSAADTGGDHLLFHAGALESDAGGVLVPGASGVGKSTLTAGLVRAGLGYLSDELVALDLSSGRLLPYAKPITLKAGSFGVLSDMRPPWDRAPEWQVAVGPDSGLAVGRPCTPSLVVVPRYVAGADTTVVALSATEAFLTLALNAVNLVQHGAAGTDALGAAAARCTCVLLTTSDLDAACRIVLALLEQRAAGAGAVGAGVATVFVEE